MKWKEIREIIKFSGIMLSFALNVVMVYTFIIAYSNPSKSVNIFIDKYSEAQIELIMIMVVFAVIVFALLLSYVDYIKFTKSEYEEMQQYKEVEDVNHDTSIH